MAHFDQKSGQIILSADDNEVLKEASMNVMNQKNPNASRIIKTIIGPSSIIPKNEWSDWMKEEAYKQNSD